MAEHAAEEASLAAAMPFNESKPGEYGYAHAVAPQEGIVSTPQKTKSSDENQTYFQEDVAQSALSAGN